MARVQFIGTVLPTQYCISAPPQNVTCNIDDGRKIPFSVTLQESKINVTADCPDYKPEDISGLFRRARHLAGAAVHLVTFRGGLGVTLLLEKAILPDGKPADMRIYRPELGNATTILPIGDGVRFSELFGICVRDPILFRLLADMQEALWDPYIALINCGRVIDGIRKLIVNDNDVEPKKGWPLMHTTLNVSRSFQTTISCASSAPRHGDQDYYVKGSKERDITVRTWQIMNRFLEYRLGGDVPLNPTEFPLLE